MKLESIVLNNRNNPEAFREVVKVASVLGVKRATALNALVLKKAPEFIAQLKAACQAKSTEPA